MFLIAIKRSLASGFCFLLILSLFFIQLSDGLSGRRPAIRTSTTPPIYNVTDDELKSISSRLFSLDIEGLYALPDLDVQNRITSLRTRDLAPRRLFNSSHSPSNWISRPSFNKLLDIITSPGSSAKKMDFLEAIIQTEILKEAHEFLLSKGFSFGPTRSIQSFKNYLNSIWFDSYKKGRHSFTGFDHVFLGEWHDGRITGLHYWMKYQIEESNGNINYLGYKKALKIGKMRTCLIDVPLRWEGVTKNSTLTTCSSPALDVALYTICFLARPNDACPIQAGPTFHTSHSLTSPLTTSYTIKAYQFIQNGRIYVGSAFPVINRLP